MEKLYLNGQDICVMQVFLRKLLIAFCLITVTFFSYGQKRVNKRKSNDLVFPFSDPSNKGGWILNQEISDEFETKELNQDKWFIEGQNEDYYIWKGRAPSQFVSHNVRVENGFLKLKTAWEPNYSFYKESYKDGAMGESKYGIYQGEPMPITTSAVVSKKRFLNGYMEIRSKVGNAAITGSFWAVGYQQELDVFEQMGNPKKQGNITETTSLSTGHDWRPPAERPTKVFQHVEKLPYRVADEFHVYGAEWGEDYVSIFIDGKVVHHFTKDDVGIDWILNNPMEIWLDSEIFHWLGLPHKEELPVDFEIDYVRVWQKPTKNILPRAFFGFEGPLLYEENPKPLINEPKRNNGYMQFWDIDSISGKYLSIVQGDYSNGIKSLQFRGTGKKEQIVTDKLTINSPQAAIKVPKGKYKFSFNVWQDQGQVVNQIYFNLKNEGLRMPFSIKQVPRRRWVTLEKVIEISSGNNEGDQFVIEIRKQDIPVTRAAKFYIDDIKLEIIN